MPRQAATWVGVLLLLASLTGGCGRPPTLEWDHDGRDVDYFEARIDGTTIVYLGAAPDLMKAPGTYRAELPEGARRGGTVTVRACRNGGVCAESPPLKVASRQAGWFF